MKLVIETPPLPLETTQQGDVRVAGTRVTLDTVVGAYKDGATPEQIALQYPVLRLEDVYAVINYYLHNRDTVDSYLRDYQLRGEQLQKEVEARFNPVGIRERLLARRSSDH